MTRRRSILGLAACLLVVTSAEQLLSQSRGSGGFSGGSGSQRSSGRSRQITGRMGSSRMPGQPDFERMRNMSPQEKMEYMQQLAEEQRKAMEEQEALAMKQALGVDERQWKVIEPKWKKVKHYREQAFIGTKPPFQSSFTSFGPGPGGQGAGGFAGGSFQFQAGGGMGGFGSGGFAPVAADPDRPLTDGERIIEELQWLLNGLDPDPGEVKQRMSDLRRAREKAAQQWAAAQEDLRKVLDLHQEATLMMMGLLN